MKKNNTRDLHTISERSLVEVSYQVACQQLPLEQNCLHKELTNYTFLSDLM